MAARGAALSSGGQSRGPTNWKGDASGREGHPQEPSPSASSPLPTSVPGAPNGAKSVGPKGSTSESAAVLTLERARTTSSANAPWRAEPNRVSCILNLGQTCDAASARAGRRGCSWRKKQTSSGPHRDVNPSQAPLATHGAPSLSKTSLRTERCP
jgi:hypothetical protein